MKKILFSVVAILSVFVFFAACDNGLNPQSPSKPVGGGASKTLKERINEAKSGDVIDLGKENLTIEEDVSYTIDKKLTIKNGDAKNATFTVESTGVEFVNLRNINSIIADEDIGDGDLSVKNCFEINSVYVNGGGANSIHIAGTIIVNLYVAKQNVRVVLEASIETGDNAQATTIKNVQINVDCKLESSDETATFEQVQISSGVEKVTLAGKAKIEKIIAEIVPPSDEEGEEDVTVSPTIEVESSEVVIDKSSDNIDITVPEDSDFEAPAPEVIVKTCTVTTVINSTQKTQNVYKGQNLLLDDPYLSGHNFDGWYKDAAFKYKVTFPLTINEDITLYAKFTVKEQNNLLEEAVDLLLDAQIEEGISKIKQAYNKEKTDETKLYYALAELASISVDQSVATLFKDNFGVTTYPSTMNALISGDWMKEYPVTRDYAVYDVYKDEYGSYVRVNGDETSYEEAYNNGSSIVEVYLYKSDDDWIDDWSRERYLANASLDENGEYLVYVGYSSENSFGTRYSCNPKYVGFEESPYGNYVKFSGKLAENSADVDFYLNDDEQWVSDYNVLTLANITLDENGEYLINIWNLPEGTNYLSATTYSVNWNDDDTYTVYEDLENGSYVKVSGKEAYAIRFLSELNGKFVEKLAVFTDIVIGSGDYYANKYANLNGMTLESVFDCSNATTYYLENEYKQIQTGSALLPVFTEPDWFEDTGFKETFNSTHTAYSVMMLMLMNAIDCNQTGLNSAVDNMLAIFNTKFETAKELASSMSNASVEVPADVFDAFGLDELLDGQAGLRIGKAELNVLVASMKIIKGTLEWLSSYDWTLDMEPVKNAFIEQSDESIINAIENTVLAKTLSVRNTSAMDKSKASFVSAISLLEDSYKYLVSSSSEYPKAYIDEIKEYGDVYFEGAKLLKNAVKNGETFYVPEYFYLEPGESWPTTAANSWMQIDMGKFFQAGYFSDIIERDTEGKVKLYIHVQGFNDEEIYDEENGYWTIERTSVYDFAIPFTSLDTMDDEVNAEIEKRGIDRSTAEREWVDISFKLDGNLVDYVIGETFFEEEFGIEYTDALYVPVF
ncbi:MAG: hypothetical protein E7064_00205 [Spirochaetaceae bacterium]|nr:hypothetical protein [Spirochaetaceae bacterium]